MWLMKKGKVVCVGSPAAASSQQQWQQKEELFSGCGWHTMDGMGGPACVCAGKALRAKMN